jgi:Zn-dependent peptidase ImmA (M78 family)
MSIELNIAPDLIQWAIERAGLPLEEVVLKDPRIGDWLNDKKKPTLAQLEAFSNKINMPFGYFFLPRQQQEILPVPFFRTQGGQNTRTSLELIDTVKLMQGRQEWLTEYLQDEGEEPLPFVGKFNIHDSALSIAKDLRDTLGFKPDWASAYPTWTDAKRVLTEHIENLGIVVCFNGVYENNNKRKLKVDEMRGFVLVDPYVPFLFINNNDSKSAQIFTLAHELAHIWLGESAAFDTRQLLPADHPLERLCDQVAAEFLVPSDLFREQWAKSPGLQPAARFFKVSTLVAARRALDLNLIPRSEYFNFYQSFIQQDLNKKPQTSGGNFYDTAKVRLGRLFIAKTAKALKQGNLLYRDLYKLTGLKGDTLQKLIEHTITK